MFKINSIFHRKESSFDVTACKIESIVKLSENEYDLFRENMLSDYSFIADRIEDMFVDKNAVTHCLLIMGENRDDAVAIDSSGASYARYSALIPNAKEFVHSQITSLADEIIKDGTQNTENGSWCVSFDEIKEHFDVTVTPNNGIGTLLLEELQQREEVAEVIATEDCLETTYYLDHCPACQDGSERLQTLMSMLGCNFEDVHLCDCDEEHDLATISELNENTLTDKGKDAWADILSAKVNRIYQGYYGLQLELSGCDPHRLEDFSMMLAGNCSAEDYSEWVNENGSRDLTQNM